MKLIKKLWRKLFSNKLIVSQIQTPDGTVLTSLHVHDFQTHQDGNGHFYMLDGGNEYQRVSCDVPPFKDRSIRKNNSFFYIRKNLYRRALNADNEYYNILLCDMTIEHLKNCILYNKKREFKDSWATKQYKKELLFRKLFFIKNG